MVLGDNEFYNGWFKQGKFDGLGVYVKANGMIYDGDWENGNRIRKGKLGWITEYDLKSK